MRCAVMSVVDSKAGAKGGGSGECFSAHHSALYMPRG